MHPDVGMLSVNDLLHWLDLKNFLWCSSWSTVFMIRHTNHLLQDFKPEPGRYSIIWCQWVLGHLTDGEYSPMIYVSCFNFIDFHLVTVTVSSKILRGRFSFICHLESIRGSLWAGLLVAFRTHGQSISIFSSGPAEVVKKSSSL